MQISRFELTHLKRREMYALADREYSNSIIKKEDPAHREVFNCMIVDAMQDAKRLCISHELQFPAILEEQGKSDLLVSDGINSELNRINETLGTIYDETFSIGVFRRLVKEFSAKESLAIMMRRGITNGTLYSEENISRILGIPKESLQKTLQRATRFLDDEDSQPNINDHFFRK